MVLFCSVWLVGFVFVGVFVVCLCVFLLVCLGALFVCFELLPNHFFLHVTPLYLKEGKTTFKSVHSYTVKFFSFGFYP